MERLLTTITLLIVLAGFTHCSPQQSKKEAASREELDMIINHWHEAAAKADADTYFGLMSPGAVFIGTDKTERWTKAEFEQKYRPYFESGKGWDFKNIERNWYYSPSGETAWFDELLDTWMGVCRASGVMERQHGGNWLISHYHLSVTVDNENIRPFIELMSD